jgi:2-dehydropantoate 2-reductase
MRFAIVGSGAVGGYYGARLAQAGHEVTFFARGAHLAAMREHGLAIRSPLGDSVVRVRAEDEPSRVPEIDVAIFAVKAYSNSVALPALAAIARRDAVALTLQNGVDSVEEVAAAVGAERVLGGSAYIATALNGPGVIEQTGTHRRIVFGEVSGASSGVSPRVQAMHQAFSGADISSEPVADARVAIWEKFCYLSPFAACTGAARVPIGPLWADPSARDLLIGAFHEVAAVARAERIAIAGDLVDRIVAYVDSIRPATRSSLLIDLQQGKPIEVEALLGTVVRRGARALVPTPIMAALYAVLKPHANGPA